MIYQPHRRFREKIVEFWHCHGSYMDMLYATILLYILTIVCLMLSNEPCPIEGFLEERPASFLSSNK